MSSSHPSCKSTSKTTTKCPLPTNEKERLNALYSYNILNSLPQEDYERIVQLASYITHMPISLISLMDQDRQWFKAKVGLEANETSREVSFCQYSIMGKELLEVEDALQDDRFKNNPLVQGNPHIRFYAGAPLIDEDGYALGTLCLIDHKPRKLTKSQRQALSTLSKHVVTLLTARRQAKWLQQKQKDLFQANKKLEEFAYIVSHDLKNPLQSVETLVKFIQKDINPDHTSTETKKHLALLGQKSQKMQEMVQGVLEYACIGKDGQKAKRFGIQKAIREAIKLLNIPKGFIIEIQGDDFQIYAQKVRIQQIFTNLICNAIKHHDKDKGKIIIKVSEKEEKWNCSIKNDGPLIDPSLHEKAFEMFKTLCHKNKENNGIGLCLVKKIVQENGGDITIKNGKKRGVTFTFSLQKKQKGKATPPDTKASDTSCSTAPDTSG